MALSRTQMAPTCWSRKPSPQCRGTRRRSTSSRTTCLARFPSGGTTRMRSSSRPRWPPSIRPTCTTPLSCRRHCSGVCAAMLTLPEVGIDTRRVPSPRRSWRQWCTLGSGTRASTGTARAVASSSATARALERAGRLRPSSSTISATDAIVTYGAPCRRPCSMTRGATSTTWAARRCRCKRSTS